MSSQRQFQDQDQDQSQDQHLEGGIPSCYKWGVLVGPQIRHTVDLAFEEIVTWKRNIFLVPYGKIGRRFILELARFYQAFADATVLESIAMKICVILPHLLLQKPHQKSRAKEHNSHLSRRMSLWENGQLEDLVNEGRCIQQRINLITRETSVNKNKMFDQLMSHGRTSAALKLLSSNNRGCLLSNDVIDTSEGPKTVHEILASKHPPGKPAMTEALLNDSITRQHVPHNPIIFEEITGEKIRQIALKTHGSAGPSGLDAYAWRRMVSSYNTASVELCNALAAVTRRLCSDNIHSDDISAFVASRLIPLDKSPGVRPIGIGDVARRIIGKSVLMVLKKEIQDACGPLQVCVGHPAGCEAAIHAIKEIFNEPDTEGTLLVDADNAFNALNRNTALHNISIICPSISTILKNTYKSSIRLFVAGGGEIQSTEGTIQGDPLGMAMYALAIVPLLNHLHNNIDHTKCKQVWYADDATAAGKLRNMRHWWDHLVKEGPKYGYFPNAKKTKIVVKPSFIEEAKKMFAGTNVTVTSRGESHLGAAIGSPNFIEDYIRSKVATWIEEVSSLSEIALSYPQAALSAFTHGFVSKWHFLMRTFEGIEELFKPLEDVIALQFIPALTAQGPPSGVIRDLLGLPARLGGLGITNPVEMSQRQFSSSTQICKTLKNAIIQQNTMATLHSHSSAIRDIHKEARDRTKRKADEVLSTLPLKHQRLMDLNQEQGASSWLTTLPLRDHGFYLTKGEFRDALCFRYDWPLKNIPRLCACGNPFSIDHAMICRYGGLAIQRHNNIRDLTHNLLQEVCKDVQLEPMLQEIDGEPLPTGSNSKNDGHPDIRARGFWRRGQSAFFDVRIFHPNAQSYQSSKIESLYRRHETEKKRSFGHRICDIENGSFTPIVLSTFGGLSRETAVFYKRLANLLAVKRSSSYTRTMTWLRARLAFELIKSATMCIRGSRSTSYRSPINNENIELALTEGRFLY